MMAKEKKKKKADKIDVSNEEKVKSVMSFMVLKKLITPIQNSKAFKLGLIDKSGKMIKEPETKEERNAVTLFDQIMFKVKALLGSRVAKLNRFIYLQTVLDDDFYDNLVVIGNVERRAAVKRVKQDIEQLIDSYDFDYDEFFNLMIAEEMYEFKKQREAENEGDQ